MALEAGEVEALPIEATVVDGLAPLRPTRVVLDTEGHVGAALRRAREGLGLDVDDIAQATRVRPVHLTALEAFDLDDLPARPFAIGYVRAYALALGLDPDSVVGRFRLEAPTADAALRAPGGVVAGPKQWGWMVPPAALIAIALVGWNLMRHFDEAPAKPLGAIARAPAARGDPGPSRLGPPLPAPGEAGAPPIYQTPGLELPARAEVVSLGVANGAPFVAGGAIYGASGPTSGPSSGVLLQARKPTSLIVRASAGSVYFARELAAGEAWRAPDVSGLIVDVGTPASLEVYRGGVARGALADQQTPLAKLPGFPVAQR